MVSDGSSAATRRSPNTRVLASKRNVSTFTPGLALALSPANPATALSSKSGGSAASA
jgi:hypothetical protein